MKDYSSLISTVSKGIGLFASEPDEPVKELLPQRNIPWDNSEIEQDLEESEFDFMPKREIKPEISEDELNVLAEQEVDLLITQIDLALSVGKGGISELLVSKQDLEKLKNFEMGKEFSSVEIEDIKERIRVKKQFEIAKPDNRKAKVDLLTKIVKADLIKKRQNGTLKLPSVRDFALRIILTEFSEISSRNPLIFSSIGKNIIQKVKSFL